MLLALTYPTLPLLSYIFLTHFDSVWENSEVQRFKSTAAIIISSGVKISTSQIEIVLRYLVCLLLKKNKRKKNNWGPHRYEAGCLIEAGSDGAPFYWATILYHPSWKKNSTNRRPILHRAPPTHVQYFSRYRAFERRPLEAPSAWFYSLAGQLVTNWRWAHFPLFRWFFYSTLDHFKPARLLLGEQLCQCVRALYNMFLVEPPFWINHLEIFFRPAVRPPSFTTLIRALLLHLEVSL